MIITEFFSFYMKWDEFVDFRLYNFHEFSYNFEIFRKAT